MEGGPKPAPLNAYVFLVAAPIPTPTVITTLTQQTNMAPSEPNAIPFHTKGQEPSFPEELDGWKGYIEWEKYPEKKKEAEAILEQYDFPDVSSNMSPRSL